ncbi:MAG: hypothetical protein Q9214_007238, partial [Letrouitia sp. 1 TL-2023]
FDTEARTYVKSTDVTKLNLNGREIRNAIQTVVLLAREQKKGQQRDEPKREDGHDDLRVEKDHISIALVQREDFLRYRGKLYKMSDEERQEYFQTFTSFHFHRVPYLHLIDYHCIEH